MLQYQSDYRSRDLREVLHTKTNTLSNKPTPSHSTNVKKKRQRQKVTTFNYCYQQLYTLCRHVHYGFKGLIDCLWTLQWNIYCRVPFFKGYKFREWEVWGNHFQEYTLVSASLQFAIHVTIGFPLIFGETNFMEVPKIHEIHVSCSPRKKAPYGI